MVGPLFLSAEGQGVGRGGGTWCQEICLLGCHLPAPETPTQSAVLSQPSVAGGAAGLLDVRARGRGPGGPARLDPADGGRGQEWALPLAARPRQWCVWDGRTPRARRALEQHPRPPAVTRLAGCTVKCSQFSPFCCLALSVLWPQGFYLCSGIFSAWPCPPARPVPHTQRSAELREQVPRVARPPWSCPGAVTASRHRSRREEKTRWLLRSATPGGGLSLCLPWTPAPP